MLIMRTSVVPTGRFEKSTMTSARSAKAHEKGLIWARSRDSVRDQYHRLDSACRLAVWILTTCGKKPCSAPIW